MFAVPWEVVVMLIVEFTVASTVTFCVIALAVGATTSPTTAITPALATNADFMGCFMVVCFLLLVSAVIIA